MFVVLRENANVQQHCIELLIGRSVEFNLPLVTDSPYRFACDVLAPVEKRVAAQQRHLLLERLHPAP
jgi:hypothetical protein